MQVHLVYVCNDNNTASESTVRALFSLPSSLLIGCQYGEDWPESDEQGNLPWFPAPIRTTTHKHTMDGFLTTEPGASFRGYGYSCIVMLCPGKLTSWPPVPICSSPSLVYVVWGDAPVGLQSQDVEYVFDSSTGLIQASTDTWAGASSTAGSALSGLPGRSSTSKMTRIMRLQLGQTAMSVLSCRSARVISNRSPQGQG